jgi:hypothetical protein
MNYSRGMAAAARARAAAARAAVARARGARARAAGVRAAAARAAAARRWRRLQRLQTGLLEGSIGTSPENLCSRKS